MNNLLYKIFRDPFSGFPNKKLAQLESLIAHMSFDQIQKHFLKKTIEAANRSNYYSRFEKKINAFPTLTKKIISSSDLLTGRGKLLSYKNSSGGSTGNPLTLVQSMEYRGWANASKLFYYKHFLGVDFNAIKKAVLWGSERDIFKQNTTIQKIENLLSRTIFLNSFSMSQSIIKNHINSLNSHKPDLLIGYAGSLYELAKFSRNHKVSVFTPKFIVSSAEMLRPFMKNEIEEIFGCRVYNFYGSREVGPIAGECKFKKMHIFSFNNYVESAFGSQNLLITNLHNYVMPLIRYEIGDTGKISKQTHCQCGINLPILERLTGRITDHFKTKSGKIVHGEYFTHLFYFRPWLSQFRVTQKNFERIEILYVPTATPLPDTERNEIIKKIQLVLGKKVEIRWKSASNIPSTPQGKHLFTKSMVK